MKEAAQRDFRAGRRRANRGRVPNGIPKVQLNRRSSYYARMLADHCVLALVVGSVGDAYNDALAEFVRRQFQDGADR
jgi:hypothetical protein